MEKIYNLKNGRILFYSTSHSLFWLDTQPDWPEPDYLSTDLYSLRIEISHKCNGYCRYCIVFGNNVQNFDYLHMKDIWQWLNEQSWFEKISDIFIIGGEPTLFFDDIVYIGEHFKGKISISTNGTLISLEMAKKLKELNIFVYISLDGPDKADNAYRVYRNGKPMYDDIIQGLNNLESAGTDKGIFMVATQRTIGRIDKIMEELSNKYTILKFGYSLPHWTENEGGIVTPEQYQSALCAIYKNRKNIHAKILQLNWRINCLLGGKVKRFSCSLHTVQTTLLPDKSIVRCSKIDHDPELKMISNSDLDRGCPIEQAKMNDNSKCSKCIALSSCGGGCPYDGLRRFGTIIDQRECVITPAVVELAIRDVIDYFENDNLTPSGLVDTNLIKDIINSRQ